MRLATAAAAVAAAAAGGLAAWRVARRVLRRRRRSPAGFTVRPAAEEDVLDVARVVTAAYVVENGCEGPAFLREGTRRLVPAEARPLLQHMLVAVPEGGGPVAAVMCVRRLEDGAAFFGPFGVDPEAQGLGLGGRMVREAARWAEAEGCERMRISTVNWRTDVFAWYYRLGFRVAGAAEEFPKMEATTRPGTHLVTLECDVAALLAPRAPTPP